MKSVFVLITIVLIIGCTNEIKPDEITKETTKLQMTVGGVTWTKTYFISENVTCFSSGYRGGLSCINGKK